MSTRKNVCMINFIAYWKHRVAFDNEYVVSKNINKGKKCLVVTLKSNFLVSHNIQFLVKIIFFVIL